MDEHPEKMSEGPIVNALSADIEGFVESTIQSFNIPVDYINQSVEDNEIERNTGVLLKILDDAGIKATFFFVGRLAHEIPHLVKEVARAGHEIACHSYAHLRIFGIDKDEFKEKISAAKCRLEDVSGRRVYGFRAPDFSITKSTIWALDILKEAGFIYDSSIYPFGLHDVYGIKDANPFLHEFPNGLIEYPLSIIKLCGMRVPFGGGGYFRLYPLWLTKYFITTLNKQGINCMSYIHPYEVGPVIPKIPRLSAYRKLRHYYHCKKGGERVKKLLQAFKFAPAIEILKQRNIGQGAEWERT